MTTTKLGNFDFGPYVGRKITNAPLGYLIDLANSPPRDVARGLILNIRAWLAESFTNYIAQQLRRDPKLAREFAERVAAQAEQDNAAGTNQQVAVINPWLPLCYLESLDKEKPDWLTQEQRDAVRRILTVHAGNFLARVARHLSNEQAT
jgi:hypothetical protein